MKPGALAFEFRLVQYVQQDGKLVPVSLDAMAIPVPEKVKPDSLQIHQRIIAELGAWFYKLRDALSGNPLSHPGFDIISVDTASDLIHNTRVKSIQSRRLASGERQLLISFQEGH